MPLIVTGGAGFIGSHLVERLVGSEPVIALDNGSRAAWENLAALTSEVERVEGDVRDPDTLRRVFRGANVVFHLAALSQVMECECRPDECFTSNVLGTYNVLKAALQAGVRRVVLASSREVYGEVSELPVSERAPMSPKNAYGTSKAAAEMYGELFASRGLEVSILRLVNVYGPRDRNRVIPNFLERAANRMPLTVYGGEQVIDFIFVNHVVDSFISAGLGTYVHGPLNVGSGVGTTIAQLARRVAALFNTECTIDLAPARDAEVTKFVADTQRAVDALGLLCHRDPLSELAGARTWCARQAMDRPNGTSIRSQTPGTGVV